jgi:DNA-binding beta-propeller fold protein YncE
LATNSARFGILTAAWCACSIVLSQPLRLEKTIPLPGVEGRIDHLSVDPARKRIFVAALGNNTVEVVDVDAGRVVQSIRGLHEPQGLFYWPEGDRLYIANGKTGHVDAYDGTRFQQMKSHDFNSDADNLRFDAQAGELFVGYGDGALGVINLKLQTRVGETILDEHPESFQLEKNGPRIFVNIPGGVSSLLKSGHVSVIDRRTRTVLVKWPVAPKQNFPMALDEANGRLFIGCRKPAELVVLDTAFGKQVASVGIAGDTDDLFYDADLKRIYVSGGEGSVTVLQQKDADHYESLATIPTAAGARTSLFVPDFKRLYVAVPHRGKQAAALMVFAVAP